MQSLEAVALQLLQAVRSAEGNFAPKFSALPPHTVTELCNQFLESKYLAGRSDNYLSLLIKELNSFSKGRERRAVASISALEIEAWLYGQGWAPRTIKGRLLTVRTLFTWGISRGLLAVNPALGVDVPIQSNEPPGIHQPAEVKTVLETARKIDLNVMRCLAVRYFAGLRTSEAVALDETEIGADYIEVTAAKAHNHPQIKDSHYCTLLRNVVKMKARGRKIMKPIRNWYYIDPAEAEQLRKLCEITTMNEASLASLLVSAALHAIVENGFKITFPMAVKIVDPPQTPVNYELNEGKSK